MFRRKKRERSETDCWWRERGLPWHGGWFESVRVKEGRECKWCRACWMLCGLQGGVHANEGSHPYCYSARAARESTEIHLCHVHVFTGGLEMRRWAGWAEARQTRWPERKTESYETRTAKSNFLNGRGCRVWQSVVLLGPLRLITLVLTFCRRTLEAIMERKGCSFWQVVFALPSFARHWLEDTRLYQEH